MADMAMRAWKSAHEEVYADFCKRMDAVAKGDVSVLMDMYLMMQKCTPPEALMMYDWLSNLANGKDIQNIANQQWASQYTETIAQCITNKRLWRCQYQNGDNRTAYIAKVRVTDGSF